MKDILKRHLSPPDDGTAFTEAVLLRAAGALYRRRRMAVEPDGPTWTLLERWARPWLVAALLVLAFAMAVPTLPGSAANGLAAERAPVADVVTGTAGPDVVLAAAFVN